jgi:hypothetical protein
MHLQAAQSDKYGCLHVDRVRDSLGLTGFPLSVRGILRGNGAYVSLGTMPGSRWKCGSGTACEIASAPFRLTDDG